MLSPVLIFNFTHVYEQEPFLKKRFFEWIDCTQISGTNCYCDPEAEALLREKIAGYPPEGLHFIDSGNYHYLSKLWTDKIKYPFALVLFDHHPDMQPSLFKHLLSCGSWVKDALDTNPFLQKIILIGAANHLIEHIPEFYRKRVICYSEQTLHQRETWKRFAREHMNVPIYISIDKDVLDKKSATTNWDQGSLTLSELKKRLTILLRNERTIGMDICGECKFIPYLFKQKNEETLNDRANSEIARLILPTLFFGSH